MAKTLLFLREKRFKAEREFSTMKLKDDDNILICCKGRYFRQLSETVETLTTL